MVLADGREEPAKWWSKEVAAIAAANRTYKHIVVSGTHARIIGLAPPL
jgi:hypothetical protein